MASPLDISIPSGIDPEVKAVVAHTGMAMSMPVWIGPRGGKKFLFPLEPLVSVRGSKTITRRNIAKRKNVGSVKELWSLDDYEVMISGQLYDPEREAFPTELVTTLHSIFTSDKMIDIECSLCEALGIYSLAIVSLDLPNTAGIARQNFAIRAYSDYDFDLL